MTFAAVAAGSASAGPPWGQPPRGHDQASVEGCGPDEALLIGDGTIPPWCYYTNANLMVEFSVPSAGNNGQALSNGRIDITLPPGTTLNSTTPTGVGYGASPCAWTGTVTVFGQTVEITGISCSTNTDIRWGFNATVGSAPGTYTLSGDYKIDNNKRSTSNVYRYAHDPVVTVAVNACNGALLIGDVLPLC